MPHRLVHVLFVASAMTLAGHDAALHAQGKKAAPPSQPLVWPLPPEQPRIRFVAEYRGVSDFNRKKPSRWKSILLGPEQQERGDHLVKPYGVAASSDGRIFLTDTVARRVFVFNPDRKSVTFIGDSGPGKISKPIGVAVDGSGTVFIADATLNRVLGYGPDNRLTLAIGHEGELESPSGLAFDDQQRLIYVADAKKHQVFCYAADDGSLVRTIGKRGVEQGEFNFPTNLAVDREGHVYVADTLNFRVQVFNRDGAFVKSFGSQGDGPGELNRAKGVGVDSEGHVYIADSSFNNVQIFDADGNILMFVGTPGTGPGEFLLPAGLFVDARDRIYVADQGNARVQVFQYLKSGSARKP